MRLNHDFWSNLGFYGYLVLSVLVPVLIVAGFIAVIIFSNTHSGQPTQSSQIAKTNQELSNKATQLVTDTNQKLAKAANVYDQLINSMDDECAWEQNNISEEAGNICNNNAVEPWYSYFQDAAGTPGIDINYGLSESDSEYIAYDSTNSADDVSDASSIMDSYPKSDTAARQQLINTIISRRNTVWTELFNQGGAMFTAIENECAWLNANISPGAGAQCQAIYTNSPAYHYANGWDYTWDESN